MTQLGESSTLALDGVTAGYGQTTVLRNVSLEVGPSSVVALLGPNGAGKTTLLRVASGFLPISTGRLWFEGSDVTKKGPRHLAGLGVCHVPEGRGVFPSLTVRENLSLFSKKGTESESLERAVRAFPALGALMNQIAGSLSGGEQQMLATVRSYISSPRLVMVDEASMGLAPFVVDSLFEFLTNVAADGTSLLIVEQYVHRVLSVADKAYVLNRGRIVFGGGPKELVNDQIFDQYFSVESV